MKEALSASAFSLPSVIFSPFPLNTGASAYLFLPLTSVVFIDAFLLLSHYRMPLSFLASQINTQVI